MSLSYILQEFRDLRETGHDYAIKMQDGNGKKTHYLSISPEQAKEVLKIVLNEPPREYYVVTFNKRNKHGEEDSDLALFAVDNWDKLQSAINRLMKLTVRDKLVEWDEENRVAHFSDGQTVCLGEVAEISKDAYFLLRKNF